MAAEEATVGSSAGRRKVRDKERTVWFLKLGFAIQKYIFNYSPASIRPFVKKLNVSVCAISGQIVHKDLNFTSYVRSDECFMNAIELKDLILFSFFRKWASSSTLIFSKDKFFPEVKINGRNVRGLANEHVFIVALSKLSANVDGLRLMLCDGHVISLYFFLEMLTYL